MQNFMQRLKWQHIMKSSPIKVRVDKCDIVIAGNHISQSRKTLLYPLDLHAGGVNLVHTIENLKLVVNKFQDLVTCVQHFMFTCLAASS